MRIKRFTWGSRNRLLDFSKAPVMPAFKRPLLGMLWLGLALRVWLLAGRILPGSLG
jgi:hypothetical protein